MGGWIGRQPCQLGAQHCSHLGQGSLSQVRLSSIRVVIPLHSTLVDLLAYNMCHNAEVSFHTSLGAPSFHAGGKTAGLHQ